MENEGEPGADEGINPRSGTPGEPSSEGSGDRDRDAAHVRRIVDQLARNPFIAEDDGSLTARLFNQTGLADAMLARHPLEPDDTPNLDRVPEPVALLLDVSGPVGLEDLGETLDALAAVRSRVNTLEAIEGLLLERARLQSPRVHGLLDESDPMVTQASPQRRLDLAHRVVVSEAALTLKLDEQAVTIRLGRAQALAARAPRTLADALAGQVSWGNAGKVADSVIDLDDETAAALDAGVAHAAGHQTPRRFTTTLRRVRDRIHPTPREVRHQEAATKREVRIDPASDGMAYLTLFAPAPAIHAIHDRLTQVARTARSESDARTEAQLRADTLCALLLDDGTLDLEALANAAGAASPSCFAAGAPEAASSSGTDPADTASSWSGAAETASSSLHAAKTASSPSGFADPADSVSSSSCAESARAQRVADAVAGPRTDVDPPDSGNGDRLAQTREERIDQRNRERSWLATVARSVRPKIYLTVPVLTLLGHSDQPALLDGVVPIDADTARELAGLSTSFTRLLTHPETGQVLAVGSDSYRPPADLRHYLKVRDTTCRFPGCNRRAADTDGDHTTARAAGGRTDASNLAQLCRRHHVLKHQGAFAVTQSENGDGTLTWTTPTGRTHTTRPADIPATVHTRIPRFDAEPPGNAEQDPGAEGEPILPADPLGDPPF